MQRSWVPFVLLGAVVVAAMTVFRSKPVPPEPEPAATSAAPPRAPPPHVGQPPPSASTPGGDPPVEGLELRETHMHLAHELCEAAAEKVNQIHGREPTDPKGQRVISVCLFHGNVAWYKCILQASSPDDVARCDRRLLIGDNVPK